MSKKLTKSKKEEALAFLDDLDKLGEEDESVPAPAPAVVPAQAPVPPRVSMSTERPGTPSKSSIDISRKSIDSSRSAAVSAGSSSTPSKPTAVKKPAAQGGPNSTVSGTPAAEGEDPEAALAYLQAQIDQKRPVSRVQTPTLRAPTPPSATIGSVLPAPTTSRKSLEQTRSRSGTPVNEETTVPPAPTSGGWGFKPSFWSSALQTAKSTASSAISSASQVASAAQNAALAQAEKNGVNVSDFGGLGVDLRGLNLDELKKAGSGGLEALRTRVGEGVKGVDLEKLRHDILAQTTNALTELINTVAPPISEHEVLQVWLTHRMKGYDGVEGVVYTGMMKMMEQTSSSELEVFFAPPSDMKSTSEEERSINPVDGWETAWTAVDKDLEGLKMRAEGDERKGVPNPELPVTTVPIYLHIQPLLASLPYDSSSKQLTFIITLHDDVHSLKHSTVTQYSPSDWLEVEYEKSDWVEERLVDVLRVGVEVVVQDYVAVRMGLKAKVTQEEVVATEQSS